MRRSCLHTAMVLPTSMMVDVRKGMAFNSTILEGTIVQSSMRWIWNQYDQATGAFRLSPQSPPCLIGSSCGALALETLGSICTWPKTQKASLGDLIRGHQRMDGWFEDPYLDPPPGNTLDKAYLRGHATFLAMMALDALGQRPGRYLEFLDQWREDDRVYSWIDKLDWTKPWRESNWVEWIGYWLLADAGLTAADVPLRQRDWPEGFGGLMAWLEDHQDPSTGMWGDPPFTGDARTLHLMAASYHHYVFYYATGRPIQAIEAIVDQTLTLQQRDGLFGPGRVGGGPCEDLDAIDILANMHRIADYRRPDIEMALRRALGALLANQRPNGAFVYAFDDEALQPLARLLKMVFRPWYPPGPRTRLRTIRQYVQTGRSGAQAYYAGCPDLPFRTRGGDMFSQWFRPLAIAIAASVVGPDRSPIWWNFGFRRQITQGWWPGSNRNWPLKVGTMGECCG